MKTVKQWNGPVCPECDCPMLRKGQKRKHPDDFRHARGCPKASKRERERTERIWAALEASCKTCNDTKQVQEGTGTASSEGGEDWRVVDCPDCIALAEAADKESG